MFTGIIEGTGNIAVINKSGSDARVKIVTSVSLADVNIGDSIAVNGVCLTVTGVSADAFSADVSAETLSRTTLATLTSGEIVNLEKALTPSSRLGGHFVLGHVDCIGRIIKRTIRSNSIVFEIEIEATSGRYLVDKGSIAVDGVSLTVNECNGARFSVNIIPHTSAHTTLHSKKPGDTVNIETDILGKYVERQLHPEKGRIDTAFLAAHGFMK